MGEGGGGGGHLGQGREVGVGDVDGHEGQEVGTRHQQEGQQPARGGSSAASAALVYSWVSLSATVYFSLNQPLGQFSL